MLKKLLIICMICVLSLCQMSYIYAEDEETVIEEPVVEETVEEEEKEEIPTNIQEFIKIIDEYKDIDTFIENKQIIEGIQNTYLTFTEEDKVYIDDDTFNTYLELLDKLNNINDLLKGIEDFKKQVQDIKTVTLDNLKTIESIIDTYNHMTDEQKTMIQNDSIYQAYTNLLKEFEEVSKESKARDRTVSAASELIGVHENTSAQHDIVDKYNENKKSGYRMTYHDPWCATFVSYIGTVCGYSAIMPMECSCQRMISLYKKLGRWEEKDNIIPNPGDVIFYCWTDGKNYATTNCKAASHHVGIVEKVENNIMTVIEGNYDDQVKRRQVKINGRYIRGFGLPDYQSVKNNLENIPIDIVSIQGIKDKIYNGKAHTQNITVTYKGEPVTCSITYGNRTSIGERYVKVKGNGNYYGSIKKYYTIKPQATSLLKVNSKKKGFKVFVSKVSSVNYQIAYRTLKGKWRYAYTSKTSRKVKKLLKKRYYVVKVRTYKKVGKKYYYSSWSKTRYVRTK